MNSGFRVEYSKDGNQVCIIPSPLIPLDDFIMLVKMFGEIGYKRWLPADERGGFIYEK